jgi:hypothetical protein
MWCNVHCRELGPHANAGAVIAVTNATTTIPNTKCFMALPPILKMVTAFYAKF